MLAQCQTNVRDAGPTFNRHTRQYFVFLSVCSVIHLGLSDQYPT